MTEIDISIEDLDRTIKTRQPIILAFVGEKGKGRAKSILEKCSEMDVEVFGTYTEFTNVLIEAETQSRLAQRAIVIFGYWEDIVPPKSIDVDIDQAIWQEVVLAYLEKKHIHFYPMSGITMSDSLSPQAMAIRAFNQASMKLEAFINQETAQKPMIACQYKTGRPPYGYRKPGDTFEVDHEQAQAVGYLFQEVRNLEPGASRNEMARRMAEQFPTRTNAKGKTISQHWDHGKIARILKRARLYCLGEYTTSEGKQVIEPSLAFLPAEWADTKWPQIEDTTTPQEA